MIPRSSRSGTWLVRCLILLYLTASCLCAAFRPNPNGYILYHESLQSPEDVKKQGGILPAGFRDKFPTDLSLYDFVTAKMDGVERNTSQYVWTSSSQGTAIKTMESVLRNNEQTQEGYIYHVRATANFVSVNGILGKHSKQIGASGVAYAALGGFRWDQIVGHNVIERPAKYSDMVPNPDFDHSFDQYAPTREGLGLAGFPAGHEAWDQSPWKEVSAGDANPTAAAKSLLAENTEQLRWRGPNYPLFQRASEAELTSERSVRASIKAHRTASTALDALTLGEAESLVIRSRAEVKEAMAWASITAQVMGEHFFLEWAVFERAYVCIEWAREAVLKASWNTDVIRAKLYSHRASNARNKVQQMNSRQQVDEAIKLAKKAGLYVRRIKKLGEKNEYNLATRRTKIAKITGVMESGEPSPKWLENRILWARWRESKAKAYERELQFVKGNIDELQRIAMQLEEEREKAQLAYRAADTVASMLIPIEEKADAPSSADEIADEVFQPTDLAKVSEEGHEVTVAHVDYVHIAQMVFEVGLWIIALIPSPAAPVAHVAKWSWTAYRLSTVAQKVVQLVPAARRLSAAAKVIQRVDKVATAVKRRLSAYSMPPNGHNTPGLPSFQNLHRMYEELHALPFPHSQPAQQPVVRTRRDMLEQIEKFERAKPPHGSIEVDDDEKAAAASSPQDIMDELNVERNATAAASVEPSFMAMSEVLNILEEQTRGPEQDIGQYSWLEQIFDDYDRDDGEVQHAIAVVPVPERINTAVNSIPRPPEGKVPFAFDNLY